MAKVERTIKADHGHFVNYIKNRFRNPLSPGPTSVGNILEYTVNDVNIFIACYIVTDGTIPRHCIVVSYNSISQVVFCDVDVFLSKGVLSAKQSGLEKYFNSLIDNYSPLADYEVLPPNEYYINHSGNIVKLTACKTYETTHKHLDEYLNNSVRGGPVPTAVGEHVNMYANGVELSAGFYTFDVSKPPMDYIVLSCNGRSDAVFLKKFEPVPPKTKPGNMYYPYNRAMAYLNAYKPHATGKNNSYHAK